MDEIRESNIRHSEPARHHRGRRGKAGCASLVSHGRNHPRDLWLPATLREIRSGDHPIIVAFHFVHHPLLKEIRFFVVNRLHFYQPPSFTHFCPKAQEPLTLNLYGRLVRIPPDWPAGTV